jgi:diguanylate cyclase (GGDEF)-like protein
MPPSSHYALVAMSNLNRAGTFRQGVSEALGLDVVLVRDGDEALQEIARRGPPALLVVDLSLPKVDGFAVIRKIRRQFSDDETRIIAVAAHESLRAAARELAGPLAISGTLPLDVDPSAMNEVLVGQRRAVSNGVAEAGPQRASELADVMDRAAIEARRRFRMPISIGYLKVGDEEDLTFHVAARDTGPAMAIGEVTEFRFLSQVAEASDPLIIPNVESHPVFAALLLKGPRPVRGFAAVPILTPRDDIRAALCVLDIRPITLSASDVDALVAFGRDVGRDLDRALSGPDPSASGSASWSHRPSPEVQADEVKALQHLAATDPLTGLTNRRGGEKHIANEISRAKRERRPLSCILLDIDRFKLVNDTFGHQAGDQLLRDISNLLRRSVRAYDILIRWGGEEFLLVLPGVDRDVARVLAERVRIAVEALDTHGIGPVTISGGVAGFENDYDFAATLKAADRRLYQAKASGRNCIV